MSASFTADRDSQHTSPGVPAGMLATHMRMRETHVVGAGRVERIVPPGPPLAAAGLFMAGPSTAGPAFRFVRVDADYPQVLVSVAGRGRAWVDGRWRPCPAGSAYVTAAGATHAYHAAGRGTWRVA